MAAIPVTGDPTLEAVDRALEARSAAEPQRGYLGMSSIGDECSRKLWYNFHMCGRKNAESCMIRIWDGGHRGEDLMSERLRMVDGIYLETIDPRTGGQFEVRDIGGHFSGHCDGIINGILKAPKTQHIWEHKEVEESSFAKLNKLKIEVGEANALKEWHPIYYAQAVLYMHYFGITRHYLTVTTPGGRDYTSCRTHADSYEAKKLIKKAERIISAPSPLDRLSDNPSWYECKWCDYLEHCHYGKVSVVNCRTCLHSTPIIDGKSATWECQKYGAEISIETLDSSADCPSHLFIPALIPGSTPQDADEDESWIEYKTDDGTTFRNGANEMPSTEIHALGTVAQMREVLQLKKRSAE